MTGWTNQLEDKLLKLQANYGPKDSPTPNAFLTRRVKGFVILTAVGFVVVSFIGMLLIAVAILSPNVVAFGTDQSLSATRFWNYQAAPTPALGIVVGNNTYQITAYGITATVFPVVSILLLIFHLYGFFKDPYFISLDKQMKKSWISLLISSALAYFVFLIIGAVSVSINNQDLFPSSFSDLNAIAIGNNFGLSFRIASTESVNNVTFIHLDATGFGIASSVLQILMVLSFVFWFYGINYQIDFKNFKNSFTFTKKTKKSKKAK
ncbi:hypothetical protein [[Mycoplasma] testudinis]|uniref:hypothetical protein n=1 Tax=[Mycoplasma] testudinis TaxID=33924 RepID=UPI000487FF02|nr:hypothetical protein [[Mycoplasma] testudinis]